MEHKGTIKHQKAHSLKIERLLCGRRGGKVHVCEGGAVFEDVRRQQTAIVQ